jgi:hypothetical protein
MEVAKTYQKRVHTHGYLPLGPGNGDFVTRLLRTREDYLTVPLLLEVFNLGEADKELAMVETVDIDNLRGELRVLFENTQLVKAISAKSHVV